MDYTPTTQPAAAESRPDLRRVLEYRITCDEWGRVMMNGVLIGAVDDEGDHGWTATNFYQDVREEIAPVDHDEPYRSRVEAVNAVVGCRMADMKSIEAGTF